MGDTVSAVFPSTSSSMKVTLYVYVGLKGCNAQRIVQDRNRAVLLCKGSDLLREAAGADVVEGDDIDVQRVCAATGNGTAVFR